MIKAVTILMMLVFSFCLLAKEGKKSRTEPVCKTISSSCSICDDGKKREPKNKKKILEISDYACASGDIHFDKKTKSYLGKETCINLSEFCSVCADQKFRFVKKEERLKNLQEIQSDLYECSTRPKTRIY